MFPRLRLITQRNLHILHIHLDQSLPPKNQRKKITHDIVSRLIVQARILLALGALLRFLFRSELLWFALVDPFFSRVLLVPWLVWETTHGYDPDRVRALPKVGNFDRVL